MITNNRYFSVLTLTAAKCPAFPSANRYGQVMKTTTIIILLIFNVFISFGQKECIKAKTLNPIDTLYEIERVHETLFLIESISDTIEIKDIRCSCGCEISNYHFGNKIYPGKPDTVIISTNLNSRIGWNNHSSTILTNKCYLVINTCFYVCDKTITPKFDLKNKTIKTHKQ